jgi:hypothetical protein
MDLVAIYQWEVSLTAKRRMRDRSGRLCVRWQNSEGTLRSGDR